MNRIIVPEVISKNKKLFKGVSNYFFTTGDEPDSTIFLAKKVTRQQAMELAQEEAEKLNVIFEIRS